MLASNIPLPIIETSAVLSGLNLETDDFMVDCLTPKIVDILSKYLRFTYPLPLEIYDEYTLSVMDELMIDSEKLINNTLMYGTPKLWGKLCKYRFVNNQKKLSGSIKKKVKNVMLFDKPKGMWCIFAAQFGHLECLKYAYEIGCPLISTTGVSAARMASEYGNLDCLMYIAEHDEMDRRECVISRACIDGHLDCIKFAHSKGYPMSNHAIELAIEHKQTECLTYLIRNGCPVIDKNIINLIKSNNVDYLKLLLESSCPKSARTIEMAAYYNSLECIKLLHESGVALCPYVFSMMIAHKNVDGILYLRDHNFSIDRYVIQSAAAYDEEDD